MCGFVGFFTRQPWPHDGKFLLARMTSAIEHRGPDDHGHWLSPDGTLGLGHRRLAILDLTQAGHQPKRSLSGRYIIVYNGEIYNFQTLRTELEQLGIPFRGRSDTEVLLAAFEQWGIEASIQRCVGMFAMAVWDSERRALHLVRDRLGEKPLYYGWQGLTLLFGSELKALCQHPSWNGTIDRVSLTYLVRHNYVPTPFSIYKGIHKLEPGSIVTFTRFEPGVLPTPAPYWSVQTAIQRGMESPFKGSFEEAVDELERRLREAVRIQTVADVPVGAFLSGGIDSSTIVALLQQEVRQPVRTFSIGFDHSDFDEAKYAKRVAAHLGTHHTEQYVSSQDAQAIIPTLAWVYDEPFADSSQIPTLLVSRLARKEVTVCLSGDGGDELFHGYSRYQAFSTLWNVLKFVPTPVRSVLSGILAKLPPKAWEAIGRWCRCVLPPDLRTASFARKAVRFAELLQARSAESLYESFISHSHPQDSLVLNVPEVPPLAKMKWFAPRDNPAGFPPALDLVTYLPDDILTKVDRASMAVSLESRIPFLDHRIVEFAWTLPVDYVRCRRRGKRIVRALLDRYVPNELIDRPKMGFGIPISDWLRGPLRDWAEDLLSPTRLRNDGWFDVNRVRDKWNAHRMGTTDCAPLIWNILTAQSWLSGFHFSAKEKIHDVRPAMTPGL